jgi:hypothetical protein
MTKGLFRLPKLFPSRVPQLFFGASAEPVVMTEREKLADKLFLFLQILSYTLIVVGGAVGYILFKFYGMALLAGLGYLAGVWMRRSMGIRGVKQTTGFFARMRERALGSRPGLLEGLLEKVSQNPLSQSKCRAIIHIYDKSVNQLKKSKSTEEQNQTLKELDRKVKEEFYS